jgi:tetratricopeptide (TPR) repeat protein
MPYVNLAWLASDAKSSRVSLAQAEKLLVKASTIFPGQREVVLSLATLQQRTGELQSADTLLSAFLKSNPWDLDANLLHMQISGASQNPERLRSRLWELFYRSQGSGRDKIGRYLAWYLLGLDDYSGLKLLFAQMKNQTGSEWIPFFRGIYEAIVGNYPSSLAELKRANAITKRWQTYYNLGLIDLRNGDPSAAESDLQQADSSLTNDDETLLKSPQRAQIHVALAVALSSLNNTEAAKREALYAQDMDKNNLEASLLLKKLDSAVQK